MRGAEKQVVQRVENKTERVGRGESTQTRRQLQTRRAWIPYKKGCSKQNSKVGSKIRNKVPSEGLLECGQYILSVRGRAPVVQCGEVR